MKRASEKLSNYTPSPYQHYVEWKRWGLNRPFGTCSEFESRYFAAELDRIPSAKISKVLEIGFGDGAFLAYGKTLSWMMTGIEVIPDLVQLAQDSGYQAISSEQTADLLANSFDLVVAFDVLEHIPQDDLPNLLSLIFQKLRPGGLFIARFPNGDSPLGLPFQYGDMTHVTVIGSGKLRYLAQQAKMNVVLCGAQARVIRTGYWRHTVHFAFSAVVIWILERVVKFIVTPHLRITLFSGNLVAILQTPEAV